MVLIARYRNVSKIVPTDDGAKTKENLSDGFDATAEIYENLTEF